MFLLTAVSLKTLTDPQINQSSASISPTGSAPVRRCPPAWERSCCSGSQSRPELQEACSAACRTDPDPAEIWHPVFIWYQYSSCFYFMSLCLTFIFLTWFCQKWWPKQNRRMVEDPKSQRAQVPSAFTRTLKLLRSLWATGGLCIPANNRPTKKQNTKCLFYSVSCLNLQFENCCYWQIKVDVNSGWALACVGLSSHTAFFLCEIATRHKFWWCGMLVPWLWRSEWR